MSSTHPNFMICPCAECGAQTKLYVYPGVYLQCPQCGNRDLEPLPELPETPMTHRFASRFAGASD
jgi:predicted nucleic-acid-binding Zn-ribbon protein